MATAFTNPTFTWPFRVAIFVPIAPFLVAFILMGIAAIWGHLALERAVELTLYAFWVACAVTGFAEIVALPAAAKTLLSNPEARTFLNCFSFFGGILAIVFVTLMGWVFIASRHAI